MWNFTPQIAYSFNILSDICNSTQFKCSAVVCFLHSGSLKSSDMLYPSLITLTVKEGFLQKHKQKTKAWVNVRQPENLMTTVLSVAIFISLYHTC